MTTTSEKLRAAFAAQARERTARHRRTPLRLVKPAPAPTPEPAPNIDAIVQAAREGRFLDAEHLARTAHEAWQRSPELRQEFGIEARWKSYLTSQARTFAGRATA